MIKYLSVFLLSLFLACTPAPSAPPICNVEVDFYGDAFYLLSQDSLNATMTIDLEGKLLTARGAMTDSGQVVSGMFVGTLHAPLGDAKFDSTGVLYLSGFLKEKESGYSIIFDVLFGTDGFVRTRGYIDFDWETWEDRIHYTGTFCFE